MTGVSNWSLRAAYRLQQASIHYPTLAVQFAARAFTGQRLTPRPDDLRSIRERQDELMSQDLANVDAGHYPASLLFQMPVLDYAKAFPKLVAQIPGTIRRQKSKDYKDLPKHIDLTDYPPYFRRTFHWQEDGYLSSRSAEVYDAGVELLFMGTADVMRRQVIPPISRFLKSEGTKNARILDVACGTGRTLKQLSTAHPTQHYYGIDMSPYYLKSARRLLRDRERMSLVAENGESMPYRDGYFDVVTSTYLFHELPRRNRRNVMKEMLRVLRPGGLLVIEDSAQLSESAELGYFLSKFPAELHEPFFEDYLEDDLAAAMVESGFEDPTTERAYLAKVVFGTKPN
jgi:ubiquinone/menaquinone biosynthesis C-methylase UbiE